MIKGKGYRQILLFSFTFYLTSFTLFSQDSIPANINIQEKNNVDFQENFFKALSEKAIYNYKNAIKFLENCNELLPNNKSVLFELSKNYFKLGNDNEALEYVLLALKKEPSNLWMLEHKVVILKRLADFNEAIATQKIIAENHPKKKQELVFLHLQNRDIPTAKKVLLELEEAKLMNPRLRYIKDKLYQKKSPKQKTTTPVTNSDLRIVFEKNKSFNNLKLLLNDLLIKQHNDLLKYSEEGLTLFPAQPFVYLINGKALNNQNKYKKALQSLQNGIDFVIDNNKIEAEFYLEMAKSYKKLRNTKKANIYKNKATKILK